MKKILIFLFLGMFLISLIATTGVVNAEQQSLGIFKQGNCIQLKQVCDNCTYVNLTAVSNQDNFILIGENVMVKTGNIYNYSFCNTTSLGEYIYTTCGDLNGENICKSVDFEITYNGKTISSAQSIIYIVLFVVILFVFIITLFGIEKLPAYNQQDEEGKILSISYLKYFRPVLWFFEWMFIVAILYLSSNLAFAHLNEQLFAKILFAIFQIAFGITPLIVIVWMIFIFVNMFHDKQMQKMLNRGIFPQGNL